MSITTIPLSKETRDRLRKAGHKGQTYDEIIDQLLETAEKGD